MPSRPPGQTALACDTRYVRVSAKVDYAVRALVELAAASDDRPCKADAVSRAQDIPLRFLLNILGELRVARLVASRRGAEGGYWLACPAREISVADVIRAVEGPLADVHGMAPEEVDYPPVTAALRDVWIASRAALRDVLERTTIAAIATGTLPRTVRARLEAPGSARRR